MGIEIGRRLRALRAERGLTQVQLAVASGVQQPTISGIERGATQEPEYETLRRLAVALAVTVDEITGEVTSWPLDPVAREELSDLIQALRPDSQQMLFALARQLLQLQRDQA